MGSALLNTTTDAELAEAVDSAAVTIPALRRIAKDGVPLMRAKVDDARQVGPGAHPASADALRMQVAERLAAHRRRRSGAETLSAATNAAEPVRSGNTRSARIAATVAERYAHTPSYRAFLAAEAERATEQARAAAEVAAMNAQAIADAQQKMLDAFDEAAAQRGAQERAAAVETRREVEDEFVAAPSRTTQQGAGAVLNLWTDLVREEARRDSAETTRTAQRIATADSPVAGREVAKAAAAPAVRAGGFTVRLYEESAGLAHEYLGVTHRMANPASSPAHTNRREYRNEAEATALDEEIAFRQAPVFEEPAGPPVPLPANLIEFPRQLVASRKARPRLAEGPLREESEAAPGDSQLRIFEVDAAQISTQPVDASVDTPQWSSIWLDTPREAARLEEGVDVEQWQDVQSDAIVQPHEHTAPTVKAASIARRVTACGIDLGIAIAGVVAFVATSLEVFGRLTSWHIGAGLEGGSTLRTVRLLAASIASQTGLQLTQVGMIAGVVGLFLLMAYHALFFWFGDTTPGMRCARIALCTFADENPTRRAVRRRLGAMLLSACALGMGFAWAMLDEEQLTWHDRITRMYLRSY